MPALFTRIESLFIFAVAVIAYAHFNLSWWTFTLLFLVPDITMLGYLRNARIGAVVYNIGHSYFIPVGLLALYWFVSGMNVTMLWALPVGLIWAAHIAFDRVLGFGLKHTSGFKDTDLGRL